MKLFIKSALIVSIITFWTCLSFASDSTLDEKRKKEPELTGLDRIDAMVKEKVKGSILGAPQEGNFALFKKARLYLRGDFQLNGVYYHDRDINGYNGDQEKWIPGSLCRRNRVRRFNRRRAHAPGYGSHRLGIAAFPSMFLRKIALAAANPSIFT